MLFSSCAQETRKDFNMEELTQFRAKEKFVEDNELMYPGIEDVSFKEEYTKKINLIADDFETVALNNPTGNAYQEKIKIGLARFGQMPDTEDRERICAYIEELMDIVGLESSGGLLNDYLYGFSF